MDTVKGTPKGEKQEQMRGQGQKQGQGKGKKFKFKGVKFLAIVSVIYLIAYLYDQQKTMQSFGHAAHVLATLIPILLLVIIVTALINIFLKPDDLAHHLGEDSGLRGWLIVLSAGVISHGPMYAWYPMIQDLREKGAKDGLIIAFFYSRAVKLALLPMLATYFGITFAVVLTVLTLVAAWLQGAVMDRLGQ